MEHLREIQYQNQLNQIERGVNFLEAELKEMLTKEVMVTESDENTLNQILNDAERRIDAARRGLSLASKLKDPAQRKQHVARMLGHLNRTRSLLDRVVKEFFPENIDSEQFDANAKNNDEYITPQQAAQTLGIHPSRLQSLVMSNKLRMYNDNGKWALKGSEVQSLANSMSK